MQRKRNLLLSKRNLLQSNRNLLQRKRNLLQRNRNLLQRKRNLLETKKYFFVRNENRLERNRVVRLGGEIGYVDRLVGNYAIFFFFVFIRKSLNNRVLYRDESKTGLLSTDDSAAAETAL